MKSSVDEASAHVGRKEVDAGAIGRSRSYFLGVEVE
jgi:hypothetical protein